MAFWHKKIDPDQNIVTMLDLKAGLAKTRAKFSSLFEGISGQSELDDATWQQVRRALLVTDMGLDCASRFLSKLQHQCRQEKIKTMALMWQALADLLCQQLALLPIWQPIFSDRPRLILVIGVNGAGKTTFSAKFAAYLKAQGHNPLLAAADTFRAAAIDQLQVWGSRCGTPVIAQDHGADPAAVVFDAYQAALAQQYDYVIADTAGRLHTQAHLLRELAKIKRVMARHHMAADIETWLVLDGSLGQSSLAQAKLFQAHCEITGLVVNKLDGSAKGGAIFPITEALGVGVHFIGLGEKIEDLYPFEPRKFVEALLP
jgi:fused signal recognition particle receptor